jgi:hypothetical protein
VSGRRQKLKISLIFPIGERTTNNEFRALTQVSGTPLIKRAWQSFVPFRDLLDKVYFICLREDERRFYVSGRLRDFEWDAPYEAVVLEQATSGPAETVARGVEQCAMSGPAIVCDVDHRLQLRPFFQAIASEPTIEAQVCVWPLKGENLKRWSVGCLSPDNGFREVAERRLPASSGSFYGVLGCYYFSDISAVATTICRRGFARFSDYFNHQIAAGASIAGVHLDEAEFFGDADRIREIEATQTAFRGTIFCDIDGTILEHEDIPDYAAPSPVLPGSREKLTRWTEDGYFVILCTARPDRDEVLLTHALRRLEIPFHRLVMGLPSGPRIVINDRKPYAMFTTQATSLEITRNQGIGALELPTGSAPTVLRRFEGGSLAETLLLEERELRFVRKRASKNVDLGVGYLRLKNQFRTMERFSRLCPAVIPELFGEQDNSHEYYYDMEFLAGHAQLSECRDGTGVIALDALMEQFDRYVYCHRNAYQPLAHDWFLNHLQTKVYAKMDRLARNPKLRPLIFGEGLTIDGAPYRSLDNLMSEISDKQMNGCFRPQFLSVVHGDMTFQNIMVGEHGSVKAIDVEATDGLDAIELDLGKLFQSIHSQYDTWSLRRTALCEIRGETEIELKFELGQPDPAMLSSVRERWSSIMNCSCDLVDIKGGFFLGLHLVRMAPFRLAVSDDQAVYALATGIQWLSRSLDGAGAR